MRNIDVLNQQRDLAPLQQQQAERANELGIAQQPAQLQAAELAGSGQQQQINQQKLVQQFVTQSAQALKPLLDSGNVDGATRQLQTMKATALELGLDTTELDNDIIQLQTPQGLQALIAETNSALTPVSATTKSAGQREFENFVNIAQNPNSTKLEKDSANRALGNLAKVSTSAAERIASDPSLTAQVATSTAVIEGAKEGAKEEAKLTKQKKFKPEIAKAVKLAQKEAEEKGEVLTDLARMEASLPGVKEAVGQLIELSNVATSTLGGRAFDFLIKESGFGSTKGADARAKLIAIVDNQVLPLLKETFGAAFTVQEGENLKASLVDPDASPSQKKQQLEAFLAQKERNIRTKQTQLGQETVTDEFAGFKVVR
ncbi:MAG: hypothetical protein MJK15_04015 [Colwellia sp.]|nr:hypothetical protein [Colwellia sp.]